MQQNAEIQYYGKLSFSYNKKTNIDHSKYMWKFVSHYST
jgi:hypothetical protein